MFPGWNGHGRPSALRARMTIPAAGNSRACRRVDRDKPVACGIIAPPHRRHRRNGGSLRHLPAPASFLRTAARNARLRRPIRPQPARAAENRSVCAAASGPGGPHGRRHRSPLPAAVQASGRRLCRLRDGGLQPAALEQRQDLAPHRPCRRDRAQGRADRRRRPRHDGRGSPLQRRTRRADHRHQHGVSGQEGLQRLRRLRPDGERAAGHRDHRARGQGRAGAGHRQDAYRHRP